MQIFEYKNFRIVGATYETSKSWGHTAILLKGDQELSRSKIRYYNRTWERYTYQSVITDAIYNAIEDRKNYLIADYKDKMKVSRITKTKKEEVVECDKEMIALRDVYNYFLDEYHN